MKKQCFLHKFRLKLHRLTEPTADNSKGIMFQFLFYIFRFLYSYDVCNVCCMNFKFLYHYYALSKLYTSNVVVAFHGYQYKSFGPKWVFTAH